MNEKIAISTLKERHQKLYPKIATATATMGSPQLPPELEEEAQILREDISKLLTKKGFSFGDYEWLANAQLQWDALFAANFQKPSPVDLLISTEVIRKSIPQTLAISEGMDPVGWMASLAARSRIKQVQRLSSDDEKKADYLFAETFLAWAVLEGIINFAVYGTKCYNILERQWLRHVKSLGAYFGWVDRGARADPSREFEDYIGSCNHIQSLLANPGMKGKPEEFESVLGYLTENYIDSQGRLLQEASGTKSLIERKAKRLWETTERNSVEVNWKEAERYTTLFYEGIIPAVVGKDPKATRDIVNLLCGYYPGMSESVVNCFEMAIGIYFLDPTVVSG
jgi:hypothetical protein